MAGKTQYSGFAVKLFHRIADISPKDWNRLAGVEVLPFLEWEWLAALEESGSASPQTDWRPLHLTLWDGEELLAAAPLYLRSSSRGEFVYDYFWADAAQSMGARWYPKLVGVVPATPAEGYRFLTAPGKDEAALSRILFAAAEALCRDNGIAGLHILFADPAWTLNLEELGCSAWEHSHFLWQNEGFTAFDDYLDGFTKNQRKNIRKEYQRPRDAGIALRIVPGIEAEENLFRRLFELYTLTNDKFIPWDARFVNEDFFLRLEKTYRHRLAFVEARKRPASAAENCGSLAALALLVRKENRLWGRYWGAYEEIKDLHFAACYYAPIDWAIAEKISSFDPGAGSPHKVRRGFRAVAGRSYHKFFDPVLERLFTRNIGEVNRYEREEIASLRGRLPFKNPQPLLPP
ncbi:MAG: GNAT family N-acetyltransferase [Spirochaetales bacterium]|jgi:predicted N-acyltransferase|nr:GNAT family N-acetyltransferase [Spirochaetales bacterium]